MEKFKYYVVYTCSTGWDCYEAAIDAPLETFTHIVNLAMKIAKENDVRRVVIVNWTRIQ